MRSPSNGAAVSTALSWVGERRSDVSAAENVTERRSLCADAPWLSVCLRLEGASRIGDRHACDSDARRPLLAALTYSGASAEARVAATLTVADRARDPADATANGGSGSALRSASGVRYNANGCTGITVTKGEDAHDSRPPEWCPSLLSVRASLSGADGPPPPPRGAGPAAAPPPPPRSAGRRSAEMPPECSLMVPLRSADTPRPGAGRTPRARLPLRCGGPMGGRPRRLAPARPLREDMAESVAALPSSSLMSYSLKPSRSCTRSKTHLLQAWTHGACPPFGKRDRHLQCPRSSELRAHAETPACHAPHMSCVASSKRWYGREEAATSRGCKLRVKMM